MYYNFEMISQFGERFKKTGLHRVGWLYGYFTRDYLVKSKQYRDGGVKCVVEALFEPIQESTKDGANFLSSDEAENELKVADTIAKNCKMQRVGWIFTSDDQYNIISPRDLISAAVYQNQHMKKHIGGYNVPKFFSLMVKKWEDIEEIQYESVMIADMFCAGQRDGLVLPKLNQNDQTMVKFVDSKKNPKVPCVRKDDKNVKEAETEFFLVRLGGSAAMDRHIHFVLENYPQNIPGVKQFGFGDTREY